jgi:hypothetical protein
MSKQKSAYLQNLKMCSYCNEIIKYDKFKIWKKGLRKNKSKAIFCNRQCLGKWLSEQRKRDHKICKSCLVDKPIEEYYYANKEKTRYSVSCKECVKALWTKKHKARLDKPYIWIKYKYNLSVNEYLRMRQDQNELCAICNKKKKLVVDHCHSTGKVRGLLCGGCNKGIGCFEENIESLNGAIKYLCVSNCVA